MGFDFPSAPTVGQVYQGYTWDAEKWTTTAVTGAVRYDTGQSLTAPQQTQARQNIYAAPFDALNYNGMQINGSMDVSQELPLTLVAVNNNIRYVADGWGLAYVGTGTASSAGQIAITSLPGFPNCLVIQATAANSLAGSLDGSFFYQFIEGFRWARLGWGTANPQPITIGFWVLPNISGTMAVSVRGAGHSYVVDVPVTAGSWQYKTVTIFGDTTGTWPTNNAAGATISFCFGAGSGRITTANTWFTTDANRVATSATTNFFSSTGTCYLTGVVVLPGIEAPSAGRSALIMRPYDQELLACMRYFYRRDYPQSSIWIATLQAYTTTAAAGQLFNFPVKMRAAPTAMASAPATFGLANASGSPIALTAGTIATTVDFAYLNGATSGATLVAGNAVLFATMGVGYHMFDARL